MEKDIIFEEWAKDNWFLVDVKENAKAIWEAATLAERERVFDAIDRELKFHIGTAIDLNGAESIEVKVLSIGITCAIEAVAGLRSNDQS